MKIILFIFIIFLNIQASFAQCGCSLSPPIASSTPFAGAANAGFLTPNENRAALVYRFSYGDSYYFGDIKSNNVDLKNFQSHFVSLNYSRGISEKLNFDAEISGYALKKQNAYDAYFTQKQSGISRIALMGKYNLFNESLDDIELNLSLGMALPLKSAKNDSSNNTLKHIQTSTGAYSGIFGFFAHKYYKKYHFFLVNRGEYNFKNNLDYKYGTSFYTSFISMRKITNSLTGILELRNEFRLKDKNKYQTEVESGGSILLISPQFDYKIDDFDISLNFDYPFYKYYNGKQPAFSYTSGLTFYWKF